MRIMLSNKYVQQYVENSMKMCDVCENLTFLRAGYLVHGIISDAL